MELTRLISICVVAMGLTACAATMQQPDGHLPKQEHKAEVSPAEAQADRSIGTTINRFMPGVRDCYKIILAEDVNREGRIIVAFKVTASGDSEDVKIKESDLPEINACMVTLIEEIKFPPQKADATATYPFKFSRLKNGARRSSI